MKKFVNAAIFACAIAASAFGNGGAPENYDLKIADIRIRDPFVFADEASGKYFMPARWHNDGFIMYESKDLKNWRNLGKCFNPAPDFWGKGDFWAPDMFKRNVKYYIISTCVSDNSTMIDTPRGKHPLRGSFVLEAEKPEGPYTPVVNRPYTPKDWLSLDGTLFEEDGKLWTLYCHEWFQTGDGEVVMQEMSDDLAQAVGEPILLFKASEYENTNDIRVTDAPVVNRAPDGTLFMTWSTIDKRGGYVIVVALSESGKLKGPWKQLSEPLNLGEDGGHAMVFKSFDGKTYISYHSPNGGDERFTVRELTFEDGLPKLGQKL